MFGFKPKTLFVFGDSYADTGNTPVTISASWRFPYGITFPGKPAGRFSDGRVSTDYLDYSSADLNSSVALFSIVGNDYLTYDKFNGTQQGRPALIRRVVKQILLDVKRIKDLGVRKVIVALSPPQKCVPLIVTPKGCDINDTSTSLHNSLLRAGLIKLNVEKNDKSFLMFDLYNAFVTIFKNKGVPGVSTFSEPLKACCVGTKPGNSCGTVGKRGEKLFSLCKDPSSFFFWDDVHVSDQGWRSIFSVLNFT
ncbi:unnamed protein product [Arabis nemorensis]|uniref:SGNH hydrolase-type esterase domain-containing protein n=1 Tax=Arabis nemorensis TaxID=586526 RepID=A0A565BL26_9BRAS|nr:unnamed protein product [Arabis nemorensis]